MKDTNIKPLPMKGIHIEDADNSGLFTGGIIAGMLITILIILVIIGFVCANTPDKYITQDAKVSAVYWDELHGEQIVALQDEDGEEWQVYNNTLRLGDSVVMKRDTKETPDLSDDEIVWVCKK